MRSGSYFNTLLSAGPAFVAPAVGMGATRLMWSDRVAGTIVEIYTDMKGEPKSLLWQEDTATRTDTNGMCDSGQAYSYAPNIEAEPRIYTLRKDGTWVLQGARLKNGERLLIGARKQYHDYSF